MSVETAGPKPGNGRVVVSGRVHSSYAVRLAAVTLARMVGFVFGF